VTGLLIDQRKIGSQSAQGVIAILCSNVVCEQFETRRGSGRLRQSGQEGGAGVAGELPEVRSTAGATYLAYVINDGPCLTTPEQS
jgi:hypothetical protein